MKKFKNTGIFVLGIRLALTVAIIATLLLFAILLFLTSPAAALLTSIAFGLIIGLLIYQLSIYLIRKRLDVLLKTFENISNKDFRNLPEPPDSKKDELHYLAVKSKETSLKVDKEYQRLNRIENYRKEFIGDISHELKTPTFAIQGFIETLLDGAIDDPKVNRKFLEKAMNNANRLNSLIQDLMEISRLETGDLAIVKEPVNLNETIREVTESLQQKASEDNIKIEFDEPYKDVLVEAEPQQLKQVIINLIDNAIKYNKPNGKVIVGLNRKDAIYGKILVYVQDTGIGIPPEKRNRITERFYRVDKSRSREKGGTGLGLSIVKHILEAHNEELYIDSTPEVGSTFTFTIQTSHRRSKRKVSLDHEQNSA